MSAPTTKQQLLRRAAQLMGGERLANIPDGKLPMLAAALADFIASWEKAPQCQMPPTSEVR